MGFPSAGDVIFHKFLEKATNKGIVKVQQSGFVAHSSAHPRLIIQMKEFDPRKLLNEICEIQTWEQDRDVDGYRYIAVRTGVRKSLKTTGKKSYHKWFVCVDCDRKIPIGKPYAVKVDYTQRHLKGKNVRPIYCKCISCYIKMLEVWDIAHLN